MAEPTSEKMQRKKR